MSVKRAVLTVFSLTVLVPATVGICLGGSDTAAVGKQSASPAAEPAHVQPAKQAETPKTADAEKQPAASGELAKSPDLKLVEVEKEILEKTNAQRVKYGLPPLVADRSLLQTARSHAAWMTNNRTLQHTSQPVGENIAMGQRTTDEAVTDWMNSSGHRANILSRGYHRTGVAAYQTSDGTIYWCQQFLP